MQGLIDIHCHVLPGVDDGPETLEAAVALVRGLRDLGFERLVATPHVRPPRWDQDLERLGPIRDELVDAVGEGCPRIDIAAENFFDDVVWRRFKSGELIRYPGGEAALVEIGSGVEDVPVGFDRRLFEMSVNGVRPVLAHPERQLALANDREALERLFRGGTVPVISITSLAGFFGGPLKRRAESILRWAHPIAAATDAHSAEELSVAARGIKRLRKLRGDEGVEELMSTTPRSILGEA